MPRFLDLECSDCGATFDDIFFMHVPTTLLHWNCGGLLEEVLRPRRPSHAQWSDKDAVVVFRDASGKLRYPGQNNLPTPAGYERVVMKSLQEVNRFERDNNVCNEAMHFDRNGRSYDGDVASPGPKLPSKEERYRAFLKGWNGGA